MLGLRQAPSVTQYSVTAVKLWDVVTENVKFLKHVTSVAEKKPDIDQTPTLYMQRASNDRNERRLS